MTRAFAYRIEQGLCCAKPAAIIYGSRGMIIYHRCMGEEAWIFAPSTQSRKYASAGMAIFPNRQIHAGRLSPRNANSHVNVRYSSIRMALPAAGSNIMPFAVD